MAEQMHTLVYYGFCDVSRFYDALFDTITPQSEAIQKEDEVTTLSFFDYLQKKYAVTLFRPDGNCIVLCSYKKEVKTMTMVIEPFESPEGEALALQREHLLCFLKEFGLEGYEPSWNILLYEQYYQGAGRIVNGFGSG